MAVTSARCRDLVWSRRRCGFKRAEELLQGGELGTGGRRWKKEREQLERRWLRTIRRGAAAGFLYRGA
jgi:hypothetical protein